MHKLVRRGRNKLPVRGQRNEGGASIFSQQNSDSTFWVQGDLAGRKQVKSALLVPGGRIRLGVPPVSALTDRVRCYRAFLSCDWGTTSFRLRWVSMPERQVYREIQASAGSKSLYDAAVTRGDSSEAGRGQLYAEYLRSQLAHWEPAVEQPMPLVISGMASSSVGWKEIPYAKVPFLLDGTDLRFQEVVWEKPSWIDRTYLISGVCTDCDLMRGEETQAIGGLSDPEFASWGTGCLMVLPGTHSKHLAIRDGSIVDLRSYMTGELLSVLLHHSLLKANTDRDALKAELSTSDRESFAEGFQWSMQHGMLRSLFRTRTRALLDRCPSNENTWFLSGVLIGAEVREIPAQTERVLIGGSGVLGELYSAAVRSLKPSEMQVRCLSPAQLDRTAALGHALFLERFAV